MEKLWFVETRLAEHCNLKCRYCSQLSPIAEPEFPDTLQILKDWTKLGKLTNGEIGLVSLSGGEPLLNPDIAYIIRFIKGKIPKSELHLTTNGILLNKMSEKFWASCRLTDIIISVSPYDVSPDTSELRRLSKYYDVKMKIGRGWTFNPEPGIKFEAYGNNDVFKINDFQIIKFNIQGLSSIEDNFRKCVDSSSLCPSVHNGRFYPCHVISTSHHLEKKFGVKFERSENDSLLLNDINHESEIMHFLRTPKLFCRYCVNPERKIRTKYALTDGKYEDFFIN